MLTKIYVKICNAFVPSYFYPLSLSPFIPSSLCASRHKNPLCYKGFMNKFDLTCWFSQANTELYFQSRLKPPVPVHHPPVQGDDWQQDGDPASLFFWSDTESNKNGTVVAALWAHTLFTRGQEVMPAERRVTVMCRTKRNIETFLDFVTFAFVSCLQIPADSL